MTSHLPRFAEAAAELYESIDAAREAVKCYIDGEAPRGFVAAQFLGIDMVGRFIT